MKRLMVAMIVSASVFVVYLLTELPPREEAAPAESFVVPKVTVNEELVTALYKNNCLSCHGGELRGGFGPSLTKVGAEMSLEKIYAKIANGGGGMPKFESKLTEDELAQLANWLANHN
ncbi:c-type cytochrome [Cohnella sp. GCM10027633]|uniref:c-type cytochrome n=1 Tax=unclassified Cohnella TaxID=2636738 RepID=UPI0036368408